MGRRDVKGLDLPGPRLTAEGALLLARWLAAPTLALIVAADLLGWAVARALWGVCFGLVCLI
jgi:hypothetical protein